MYSVLYKVVIYTSYIYIYIWLDTRKLALSRPSRGIMVVCSVCTCDGNVDGRVGHRKIDKKSNLNFLRTLWVEVADDGVEIVILLSNA